MLLIYYGWLFIFCARWSYESPDRSISSPPKLHHVRLCREVFWGGPHQSCEQCQVLGRVQRPSQGDRGYE